MNSYFRRTALVCGLLGTCYLRRFVRHRHSVHRILGTPKILFRVPADDGADDVETLWAKPVGDDQYEVANSPFYAYGVSWKDTVFAPFDPAEEMPCVQRVVTKSGHRTVRVIFEERDRKRGRADRVLQGLVRLGCTHEGADPCFFSVDVPPGVDLDKVGELLDEHELDWEFGDPSEEA